ncbi:YhcH/YjgK/YiaL family protein [Chitinispirillales bacterium ANBcel5]|uniref:YhcH/YjgK/YiaL family protein n=1 Tax=Cellulosispirillum alkaliphilum TaxID=3039283 RepID=UPI002A52003B|nr:YhcH/YjgK/YiaL family protein [Chitinispirillales bacterium ANBcel5]
MILDLLTNLSSYKGVHPGLPTAIHFLQNEDLDGFTHGQKQIMGDNLYALALTGHGLGLHDSRLEVHKKYIDIYYCISGTDNIGWKNRNKCIHPIGDYDNLNDSLYFYDKPDTWFGLVPGSVAIFFPEDAHAPHAVKGLLHIILVKVLYRW